MKPGDLVRVDPVDWDGTHKLTNHIVLKAMPGRYNSVTNPFTAQLVENEIGLIIAIVFVKNERHRLKVTGKSLEVCTLFGNRLGWTDARHFSVL